MSERVIMDEAAIQRTVTRIAHEILEYNKGTDELILLGIKTRGAFLARRIQQKIEQIEQIIVPTGTIDITQFRDDLEQTIDQVAEQTYEIDVNITNQVVIIVDDVLYTGRTVRASLDAVLQYARPSKIGLATLIDRGHRELPIRADFVGKNIPTAREEAVSVFLSEIDSRNAVVIE
ncbi:bifunctional pyr operon transcriptional regulator/uracil phosphoribosyltransferase PyrR [Staphylococcus cohnii]|uniref:bifunctional pyr operon transcriptional regulator/uracil phosphoribosyltransferase PyrR n=1 Tax=unclassified Staphylococcus cohnii species complex TaxID=3239054 RepID=UPI00085C541B|nr:bifunctional pyr operon transcriptional regulator/uracil phosphoribosyltransferase PyrR [Staphylococcus cohnii]PTG41289.1 bifunctional pyr operon transcriptional regulator/uracil phosphoribosyltransferase PyrR [Staphylococcus cohnii]PUZ35185.1 bifunctional pyr operon transcriptional regulator/uracil phosphoribosyltransferase PyrR [Staphylococcus cohnii]SCS57744.1 bifunctional pyrimidine regulatory protein PyrR uracil phosphoribosyltransferase [Staphylococcus cohnii subsp. cohnii]